MVTYRRGRKTRRASLIGSLAGKFALICGLMLALAPTASAMPLENGGPLPPAAVHPVVGPTGYGEWAARYGNFRHGHVHEGQDVFAPAGTPLVAVRDAVGGGKEIGRAA